MSAVPKRRFRVTTKSDPTHAVAESFFAMLEKKRIEGADWHTPVEARRAIFAFMDNWYDGERRHSSPGYRTPAEFEQMAAISEAA